MKASPPLKYPGGKHYLAGPLWDLAGPVLPKVVHCVEAYCGGCAWTLEGLRRNLELSFVVNDTNGDLTNFWRVLGSPLLFPEFVRRCQATPFSESLWSDAKLILARRGSPLGQGDDVLRAWAYFVFCRQSMAGRGKSFSPLSRNRTRRGMNEQASSWLTAVEGLAVAHALLKKVAVACLDALKLIPREDGEATMFYFDPPYMHNSRSSADEYGEHEMTEKQHALLLATLADGKIAEGEMVTSWGSDEEEAEFRKALKYPFQGRFILSGYATDLYDATAVVNGWNRYEFDLPNNAASGASKRRMTEVVYTNF